MARSSVPRDVSEPVQALGRFRLALAGAALFGALVNILMLTGAIYMLQVYDRILPSRSIETLVAISVLGVVLFLGLAVFDALRNRLMVRIGAALEADLAPRAFELSARLPLVVGGAADQPLRDLGIIRSFMTSPGPSAIFDLPWIPFYVAIIFSFHPVLGLTALGGAVVLVGLTILTELLTKRETRAGLALGASRDAIASQTRRNAEMLVAMSMVTRLGTRWQDANDSHAASQARVADVAGGLGALSKSLRMILQSAVLAAGAILVIFELASPGIIIAGSVLAGRALAPVDLAIANWRGFVGARQAWGRLARLMTELPARPEPMPLPPPREALFVEAVAASPPGSGRITIRGVSFILRAGHGLGIVGPSASGKTSLVRVLVGAWMPASGRIQLDGAALPQWGTSIGYHVGYLPQHVEMLAGTIAENISRFDPDPQPGAIVAAAQAAGVHDLVVGLPQGYETLLGESGEGLSTGQRQRIALARALYGDPFMVVLDEPSSNLDGDGEAAMSRAIASVRARGGIVIIVAHRASALTEVDLVLALNDGQMLGYGPRDEMFARIRQLGQPPAPLKVVARQEGQE